MYCIYFILCLITSLFSNEVFVNNHWKDTYIDSRLNNITKIQNQYIMEGIYNANDEFPFSNLLLLKPTAMSGGNYFIKFRINEMPLYIQTPKCNTKNGILKAGKKYFSDLMFTNEHETFIQWIEKLENYCQKYIYDNRKTWFDTELEMHDIENSFSSCFKLYKSGKYYIVRSYVPTQLGQCSLKIYNENEELIDHSEIRDTNDIITILEIQGIKCSARSFQIEIEIKQMLVLRQTNLFEKCILSSGQNKAHIVGAAPTFAADQLSMDNTSMDDSTDLSDDADLGKHPQTHLSKKPLELHRQKKRLAENENAMDIKPNISVHIDPLKDDLQIDDSANTVSMEGFEEEEEDIIHSDNGSHSTTTNTIIENLSDLGPTVGETNAKEEEDYDDDESNELEEIEFTLDEIPETDQIQIKTRNDVYYKMYQDAKSKAKMAKALALSSYLEAQRIKNTYMLEDLDDSDSDLEEDTFT